MRLDLLFILLCLFLYFSCNSKSQSQKEILVSNINLDYQKEKELFHDSLINFYPEILDTLDLADKLNFNSSYYNTPKEILYITVYKRYTEQNKSYLKKFIDKSEIYELSNPCIFYIKHSDIRIGFSRKREDRKSCTKFIPIPGKEFFSIDEYPNDLKFYVYQMKSGVFYDYQDSYLRLYLPDEWKNGLSRGFAISESKGVILYWLIIW